MKRKHLIRVHFRAGEVGHYIDLLLNDGEYEVYRDDPEDWVKDQARIYVLGRLILK